MYVYAYIYIYIYINFVTHYAPRSYSHFEYNCILKYPKYDLFFHSKCIYSYKSRIGQKFPTYISLYFSLRIAILAIQHQTKKKLQKRFFFNLRMSTLNYRNIDGKLLLMKCYISFSLLNQKKEQ